MFPLLEFSVGILRFFDLGGRVVGWRGHPTYGPVVQAPVTCPTVVCPACVSEAPGRDRLVEELFSQLLAERAAGATSWRSDLMWLISIALAWLGGWFVGHSTAPIPRRTRSPASAVKPPQPERLPEPPAPDPPSEDTDHSRDTSSLTSRATAKRGPLRPSGLKKIHG